MKGRIFFVILLLFCLLLGLNQGQAQVKQKKSEPPGDLRGGEGWVKNFGSPELDAGAVVRATADGGSIVLGYTFAARKNRPDLLVIRLNGNGEKLWEKTFPYAVHGEEKYALMEAADRSIYVMAPKNIAPGFFYQEVPLIMKLDHRGEVIWKKELTDPGAMGYALAPTPEGGCIFAGSRSVDGKRMISMVKLSPQGDILWETVLAESIDPYIGLQRSDDNHYLITYAGMDKGLHVVKADERGNIIWQRIYRSRHPQDIPLSLALTGDGHIVISGLTGGGQQITGFILKLDGNGNKLWDRHIQALLGGGGYVRPTADGGSLAVFSKIDYSLRGTRLLIMRLDRAGKPVWTKALGESGRSYEVYSLDRTPQGAYMMTGVMSLNFTNADIVVIKMDENGRSGKQTRARPLSGIPVEENIFRLDR